MPPIQNTIPDPIHKGKQKEQDKHAYMLSGRELMLEILIERAVEEEEFNEWCYDYLLSRDK